MEPITSEIDQVVEYVAERARKDPKVAKIVDEVKRYDDLQFHTGWKFLIKRIQDQYGDFTNKLASRLMRGEVVSQREIDYHRGFYAGALYAVKRPEQAEAQLERAGRLAWGVVQDLQQEGGNTE